MTLQHSHTKQLLDELACLGKHLNDNKISWGIGGSLLLLQNGIVQKANDIDILVSEEDGDRCKAIIDKIGKEEEAQKYAPFRTAYFYKYTINNVEVDLMSGLALEHENGIYKFFLTPNSIVAYSQINGTEIPLCALEDWYILYSLMPNKEEKEYLLRHYFQTHGISNKQLMIEANRQPLPLKVKDNVEQLLNSV
ncbi:hypothetical protein DH09_20320 [Bacillaceae bacterium JMAK1]|nr:hypothetical protein DH09_20320 [Bacillaceae bacterium JMAK1]